MNMQATLLVQQARPLVQTSPTACLVSLRAAIEIVVKVTAERIGGGDPDHSTLSDLLSELAPKLPTDVTFQMQLVRVLGNGAAHGEVVTSEDAYRALKATEYVLGWHLSQIGNGELFRDNSAWLSASCASLTGGLSAFDNPPTEVASDAAPQLLQPNQRVTQEDWIIRNAGSPLGRLFSGTRKE